MLVKMGAASDSCDARWGHRCCAVAADIRAGGAQDIAHPACEQRLDGAAYCEPEHHAERMYPELVCHAGIGNLFVVEEFVSAQHDDEAAACPRRYWLPLRQYQSCDQSRLVISLSRPLKTRR